MSFQAMTWAVNQKCGSAASKLVLLMLANHCNGHTGQCNPRHKTLAEECEMRVETLKTHLKNLESLGLITILPQFAEGVQLPNQYLVNFGGGGGEIRMGGGGEKHPPINQEFNQEDKHSPKPPATPGAERDSSASFAAFWKHYPKKVGKDAAEKAWARKVKADDVEAVMDALDKQRSSEQWTQDGGRFIPNPATWLNQGRWKDEGVDVDEPSGRSSIFAGVL
ncbi:MAG: helix-turn-helix domain-containing protein [Macromonas sp.]